MSFLSLSMDLGHETCVKAAENPRHAGIDDAGACPRKLPFIRLGRDQENSVNAKLAVLSAFTAYVLQHKNVKTNKFQFMWCFASASAAIETMKNGELTCRLNSSKSKNKLAAVEIISSF